MLREVQTSDNDNIVNDVAGNGDSEDIPTLNTSTSHSGSSNERTHENMKGAASNIGLTSPSIELAATTVWVVNVTMAALR